jgi:protein-arginine kinase activator protein McsA
MLCNEGNEKPATLFLTQIIHGEMATRNLCETCAAPVLKQIPPALWTSFSTFASLDELYSPQAP